MKFSEELRRKYSPEMTPLEFSHALNDIEGQIFSALQWLAPMEVPCGIIFTEDMQNQVVEFFYSRSKYVNKK